MSGKCVSYHFTHNIEYTIENPHTHNPDKTTHSYDCLTPTSQQLHTSKPNYA